MGGKAISSDQKLNFNIVFNNSFSEKTGEKEW
jgi:hypothetical protein